MVAFTFATKNLKSPWSITNYIQSKLTEINRIVEGFPKHLQ